MIFLIFVPKTHIYAPFALQSPILFFNIQHTKNIFYKLIVNIPSAQRFIANPISDRLYYCFICNLSCFVNKVPRMFFNNFIILWLFENGENFFG